MVRIISEYYSTEIKGFTSSESKFKWIMIFKRQEPASRQDTKAENNVMVFKENNQEYQGSDEIVEECDPEG